MWNITTNNYTNTDLIHFPTEKYRGKYMKDQEITRICSRTDACCWSTGWINRYNTRRSEEWNSFIFATTFMCHSARSHAPLFSLNSATLETDSPASLHNEPMMSSRIYMIGTMWIITVLTTCPLLVARSKCMPLLEPVLQWQRSQFLEKTNSQMIWLE